MAAANLCRVAVQIWPGNYRYGNINKDRCILQVKLLLSYPKQSPTQDHHLPSEPLRRSNIDTYVTEPKSDHCY